MNRTKPENSSRFSQTTPDPGAMVRGHPIESALMVFGLGIGVGIVLSHALQEPIRHMLEPESTTFQKISKQVMEAVQQSLPEAVARHWGNFSR
ncbi:MAG: hypothetical protein JNM18_13240 [Planctomycetaceae bacterium]|nr:hypothetical protein [Planctomycetaceae bacterium]